MFAIQMVTDVISCCSAPDKCTLVQTFNHSTSSEFGLKATCHLHVECSRVRVNNMLIFLMLHDNSNVKHLFFTKFLESYTNIPPHYYRRIVAQWWKRVFCVGNIWIFQMMTTSIILHQHGIIVLSILFSSDGL